MTRNEPHGGFSWTRARATIDYNTACTRHADNRGPLIGKQAGSCIGSRINVNIYSIDFHLVCRQIRAMLVHRANAGGLCGLPSSSRPCGSIKPSDLALIYRSKRSWIRLPIRFVSLFRRRIFFVTFIFFFLFFSRQFFFLFKHIYLNANSLENSLENILESL